MPFNRDTALDYEQLMVGKGGLPPVLPYQIMIPTRPGPSITFTLSCGLLLALAITGFATRHERLIDSWRPTHFNVSIKLDDRLTEITQARAEITIEALKDKLTIVDLDFGELPIDGVWVDGQPAKFDLAANRLNVNLPTAASKGQRFIVAVAYHGKPKDGLILTNDKDGRPSATGDNWPDRVHNWIPCLDHPSAKATVKFTVTAPQRDLVVANGKLVQQVAGLLTTSNPLDRVSRLRSTGWQPLVPWDQVRAESPINSSANSTWTYVESVPIPAYCMVIAVGEYSKSGPASPALTQLDYYVPRSDANRAVPGFAAAAPSLKFFSETIAPYPYEKLALIVGATRFGGMENSSAIVFQGDLLTPRKSLQRLSRAFNINESLEQVVAHEIAHQWFGDSVTEATWADLWLSEGFATYFAGLVVEKYDGAEAFHRYLEDAASTALEYEKLKRTPIHDTETEKLFDLLNANNYQKGAWVLHMLRSRLGDDAFFRGLKIYYDTHKNSTATTEDLRRALEKASGKDLKEFFARWVYGTGHPQYEISILGIAEYSVAGGSFLVTLKQLQPGEAFLDPVPFEVTSSDFSATDKTGPSRRLWIQPTGKETTVGFPFDAHAVPKAIQLDPDGTLLKEVVPAKVVRAKYASSL